MCVFSLPDRFLLRDQTQLCGNTLALAFRIELNESLNPRRLAHVQKCLLSSPHYLQLDEVLLLRGKTTMFRLAENKRDCGNEPDDGSPAVVLISFLMRRILVRQRVAASPRSEVCPLLQGGVRRENVLF